MPNLPADIAAAARRVHAHLAETDPEPAGPADAVLGFGMFDLRLPVFCGDLLARGLARRIVFTGGLGAGTGDLGQPEADAWKASLLRAHPSTPENLIITENRSTNTGENVAFTAALLARLHPALAFGAGLRRVIVVASPSRLRRVRLTLRHQLPALETIRLLPPSSFDEEASLYARQGIDYLAHLAGEIDRLQSYPARGWISDEPLPPGILQAHACLRRFLETPVS